MVLTSLVLVTLAVARGTRLIKSDRITLGFRRWVINRWGEESSQAYLVHCSWCISITLGALGGILWAFTMLPLLLWWLAAPAALAMSYVTGLLSQIERQ